LPILKLALRREPALELTTALNPHPTLSLSKGEAERAGKK
jgi:hypothetical protein